MSIGETSEYSRVLVNALRVVGSGLVHEDEKKVWQPLCLLWRKNREGVA